MDAKERFPPPPGQQPSDSLVREDHQLLDEHVRVRLGLAPRVRHSALIVELERKVAALDPQRAACEPPLAELGRHTLRPPKPFE